MEVQRVRQIDSSSKGCEISIISDENFAEICGIFLEISRNSLHLSNNRAIHYIFARILMTSVSHFYQDLTMFDCSHPRTQWLKCKFGGQELGVVCGAHTTLLGPLTLNLGPCHRVTVQLCNANNTES